MAQALIEAALNGDINTVKTLLSLKETDINYKDICALFCIHCIFSSLSHKIVFKEFLELNSHFYQTPLFIASNNGHKEIVSLLLSQPGIELNCQTDIFIRVFHDI